MIDFSKVPDWLKLSAKQAFVLLVVSSIFLFGNDSLLQTLGLLEARLVVKPWVGVVWLVSLSILAADVVMPVYAWVAQRVQWRINLKKYQGRLHELTLDEKRFLSFYIREKTRTQAAEYSDGTVSGLESAKVVYRSSNMAYHYNVFPYNIQPWAWQYLNEHPECLE